MISVYTLIDPRDGIVKYVGITNDTVRRYKDHCGDDPFEGANKTIWVTELKQVGMLPEMKMLEVVESREVARERELYWIRHYKPLANTQDILAQNKDTSQSNKLSSVGVQVDAIRRRYDLTWYQIAKNANMDYAQLYRTMRQSNHTRKTLNRVCDALNCTPDERKDIFHAAGYLSPEEIEEEQPAA